MQGRQVHPAAPVLAPNVPGRISLAFKQHARQGTQAPLVLCRASPAAPRRWSALPLRWLLDLQLKYNDWSHCMFFVLRPSFCISLPDSPEAPFRGCLQVHPRTALASEGKTIDACRKGVRPDEWPLNAKVIRSEVSIPSRGFTVFGSCRAPQLVPLQTLRLDPQPGPGLRVVLISCIGGWRDCSTSRVGRPGFRGARHPCLEMTSRSIKHRRCLTNLVRKTPHGGQS